jgi:hypothetical protein
MAVWMAVWIGHIWIRIMTNEAYVWQCGLDICGLGPLIHMYGSVD